MTFDPGMLAQELAGAADPALTLALRNASTASFRGSVSRLKLGFERRPARKAVVAGDRQLRTRKGDLVGHAP